jgi:hypothetical protein
MRRGLSWNRDSARRAVLPIVAALVAAIGAAIVTTDLKLDGQPASSVPVAHRRRTSMMPGVLLGGRVIDEEDGRPIANSTLVLTLARDADPDEPTPGWGGDTIVRTDADGRFRLAIPPAMRLDARSTITLTRVEGPHAVGRSGPPILLGPLLKDSGDTPPVLNLTLARRPDDDSSSE